VVAVAGAHVLLAVLVEIRHQETAVELEHPGGLGQGLGQEVPPDATVVILAGPRKEFLAAEIEALKKYLDGGGPGCMNASDRPDDRRRIYHHLTAYGFLLCFAATSVATLYHYLLGREAPFPLWDLPVVLGTLGGLGLVIGPIGLLSAKWRRDPALMDESRKGMDVAFILMLLLTAASGLLLLALRATPLMGMTLALHLGFVFGFFLTMPYGKFVHGVYRGLALVRYAAERRRFGA